MTANEPEDETPKLFALSDFDLIQMYRSKAVGDPEFDRIAREIHARGLDRPTALRAPFPRS